MNIQAKISAIALNRKPSRVRQLSFNREEASFLPAALAIQECPPSPVPGLTINLIAGFIITAILWASIGKIDIVTVAPGSIATEGQVQNVQSPELGEVRRILIKNGDAVQKGQVLVELDSTAADIDWHRAKVQVAVAELAIERNIAVLGAVESGKFQGLKVPDDIPLRELPAMLKSAQQQTASQILEARDKINQLNGEIFRRELEANRAAADVARFDRALRYAEQRETDFKELADQKFVSRHALLERQETRTNLEGETASAKLKLQESTAAVNSSRLAKEAFLSEFRSRLLAEMQSASEQKDLLRQSLKQAQLKQKQTTIVATSAGTVQQLGIHTVGGIVTVGQQVCAIAPAAEKFEVQAHIQNKDIAFVKVGQPVIIKVSAIDFTKYGTLTGSVVSLSQSAIQDEKNLAPYWARISLEKASPKFATNNLSIAQGMIVSAEIKTGRRRIIEYVLGPLLKHTNESFNER